MGKDTEDLPASESDKKVEDIPSPPDVITAGRKKFVTNRVIDASMNAGNRRLKRSRRTPSRKEEEE
jgi:hypothetical protein